MNSEKDLSALPEPMRHSLLDAAAISGKQANVADAAKKEAAVNVPQESFFWDIYSIHGTLLPPKFRKDEQV
ncbi:MAG: hypothetical protein Q8L36_00580 [bacterium]|nr:hypothetical protein [bacterium]